MEKSYLNTVLKSALAMSCLAAVTAAPAFAQSADPDAQLIVSKSRVEALPDLTRNAATDVIVNREIVREMITPGPLGTIDRDYQVPTDPALPVYELDTNSPATLQIGVLDDETAAFDPYAVDAAPRDPSMPEGVYVPPMETSAGLGLKREF